MELVPINRPFIAAAVGLPPGCIRLLLGTAARSSCATRSASRYTRPHGLTTAGTDVQGVEPVRMWRGGAVAM